MSCEQTQKLARKFASSSTRARETHAAVGENRLELVRILIVLLVALEKRHGERHVEIGRSLFERPQQLDWCDA